MITRNVFLTEEEFKGLDVHEILVLAQMKSHPKFQKLQSISKVKDYYCFQFTKG